MAMMCSIHHPGLYLIKYCSILPPEDMAKGVNNGYSQKMNNPPTGSQKPYLPGKTFLHFNRSPAAAKFCPFSKKQERCQGHNLLILFRFQKWML